MKEVLFDIFSATLSRVPLSIRRYFGIGLGYVVGSIPHREAKVARLQLQAMLPDRQVSVRQIYASVGLTVMEALNVNSILNRHEETISFPDFELFEHYSKNKGALVLTGHFGNWELLAAYFLERGFPLVAVAKKGDSSLLHGALDKLRVNYGLESLYREASGGNSARQIIKKFNECFVVAGLIDQDTNVESVHVPFFNETASTPVSLVNLALRRSVPIMSVFMSRQSMFQYTVHVKVLFDGENKQAYTTADVLTSYNEELQKLIRCYPSQWVWFHKRWRTREDGTLLRTKEYIQWLETFISSQRS